MRTMIKFQFEAEVEVEITEQEVVNTKHGWSNLVFQTTQVVHEELKKAVLAQCQEQHCSLDKENLARFWGK